MSVYEITPVVAEETRCYVQQLRNAEEGINNQEQIIARAKVHLANARKDFNVAREALLETLRKHGVIPYNSPGLQGIMEAENQSIRLLRLLVGLYR